MSSRTVLDASLSFSAIGLRRSSAAVRSERNSWAQYIREHALSIFPARFGGEQEDRYRSFTQRGLLKVQRFGVTVMTLLFLQSSLCFARLTCDDDDEHEDAASASSTNRAFAWAASAVGFVVMWLQYGLLHFFSAERHRWARRTVQASYFVMALLFSWRFSLTAQRVVKTFAPGSDDPAAASGVNCTACTIHRGYETSNVLLLLLVHVFFGLSCRMCPRQYFALMHLTVVGYATARAVLGDQDKLWSQKYQDSIYLYFVLFMLYASLRRYDLAARAEFQRKDELEQINAAQQARLSRERELRRQQSQPPPTAEERSALEGQLELLPEPLKRARVNFNELVLGRALGSGTFGDVCLAEWRGTPCAVKRLRRSLLTTANLEALEAEIALHLSMRHPNIVSLLGCAFEPGRGEACAVLELCSRGTLEALLSTGTGVAGAGGVGGVGGVAPPKLAWSAHKLPIATGIARAMAYLHAQSPPVIHRDLKAANVLVDDGYNAKLSDFGLSREAAGGDEVMSMVGSPLFSAPELLRFERYDRQVDVWSFACLLESMTTHQRCYDGAGLLPVSRYPSLIAEGKLRPRLPASFFLAPLVERCSAPLAADRPRFDALVDLLTDTDLQQQAQLLAPGVIVRRPTEDAEPSTSNEIPPSSEREPAGIQAPRGGTTAREQSAAAASNAAAATTVRQQPPALLRKTSNAVVSLASLNTLGGAKREDGGSADDLDTGRAGQASRRLRFKALTV